MKFFTPLIILLVFSGRLAAQDEGGLFREVDVQAEYPGGMKAMHRFLKHELHYPKDARKSRIMGKVFVQFVVGVDGAVEKESVLIIKGIGASCDSEAVRVVRLFPKWKPAMNKGVPVQSRFVLPVNFTR